MCVLARKCGFSNFSSENAPIFLAKFPKLLVILILLEILQLHKIDRDTTAKRPLNERVLLKVAILIAEEFNLETLINVIPRI